MATRRKRNLLDAVLSESASMICVLDGEQRIRFFSPGLSRLTGWKPEDVEGLTCSVSAPAEGESLSLLATALAPSQAVLNGQTGSVSTVLPGKTAAGIKVQLTFVPVTDADGTLTRVLINVSQSDSDPAPVSLTQRLHAEVTALRTEFRRRFSDQSFVGDCAAVRSALNQAELLKASDCSYAVRGPSGSGRRHLAKVIHVSGDSNERSFVTLDCRLLTSEQLLTCLQQMRRDAEEHSVASHQIVGTLALVDAERCPREVQQWMLEKLQTETERVRMVAVCDEPFETLQAEGWIIPQFAEYFGTLQIELPSLHERGADISLLAQHFIEDCRRHLETSAEGMSSDVEQLLRFYRWPGNVRELRQVITEACQSSFGTQLETEDLPFAFRAGLDAQQLNRVPDQPVQSLEELMQRFETDVLRSTLDACNGNKAEAARRLGMTRPKLYRRLTALGMEEEEGGRLKEEGGRRKEEG